LIASLYFAMSQTVPAEEAETATVELEPIIVTSVRQEIPVKDSPSKITVISEGEIRKAGVDTAEDVFQYVPAAGTAGNSIYQAMKRQITLRGIPDQARTLIMVDGVPLNSAWQGRVEWGIVPAECIEKIEVVHGPMSALYGSGAMGGVINIITKLPEEPGQTLLSGKYGSLDSWSTVFSRSGEFDKFSYYLGGRIFKTGGYIPEKDPEPYNVKRRRKDLSSFLKLTYSLDEDSHFDLGFLRNEEVVCRGRRYFNIDDRANLGYFSYNKSSEDARLKGIFFINDQHWKREFDKGPNYDYLDMVENIDHTYIGTLLEASFSLAEENKFTAGFDYKHGKIHLKDNYQRILREAGANGRQHLVSVFLQDEIRLLEERLIVAFGLRGDYCRSYKGWCFDAGQAAPKIDPFSYDYDDRDWIALSPKASLVYHLKEGTTFRASFGRAFHAPDLKQLYMVLARPKKTIYGNHRLEPETLNSYEIGARHRLLDNLTLGLSFYYSRGDDFISTRTIAANTFQYDNITEVKIQGIETELKYKIDKQWLWSGSYTFNKSTIDEDEADATLGGNDLSLQPRHKAGMVITYENPKLFTLSLLLRYAGVMYADLHNTDKVKGHYDCDLKISRELNENIELALICQSLLDKEYDIPNASGEELESAGRMITGTVTVEW